MTNGSEQQTCVRDQTPEMRRENKKNKEYSEGPQ